MFRSISLKDFSDCPFDALIIWNTLIMCELSLKGFRHSNALIALFVYAKLCKRNGSYTNSTFLNQLNALEQKKQVLVTEFL